MFWNTVSAKLREILLELSNEPLFEHFTLVGGTALRLQIGHRKSEDIDFFTDQLYGSINMDVLANLLEGKYLNRSACASHAVWLLRLNFKSET